MAGTRMWPAKLPRQIRENVLRRAEVKVFDLLEEKLGAGWTVFYSRPWLGLTPTGEEKDGECDFVVAHPSHGYLAIEVKGGGISYTPSDDQWISTDSHKIRHKIKNPIRQAVSAKHELLKKAKLQRSWPGRFIRQRHGVIFPDTERPPRDIGADGPREIFCCRDDLPNIATWVRARLSGGDEQDLGADGIRAFEELLAAPVVLRVPLAHYLDDDDRTIEILTPQQFYILDSVQHLERVAAGGGAGTGKTILAMEDAARLSSRGLKTALVCLSEALAVHIATRLQKVAPEIQVRSFRSLCDEAARSVGHGYRTADGIEKGVECLLDVVRESPSFCFDAVIVDEAQDFRTHWWVAIEALLKDRKTSWLHAYFDTNQTVYGDIARDLKAFQIVPIHLTRNLRNTQHIHGAASKFYKGIPVTADGPEGMEVEWHRCAEKDLARLAVSSATQLMREKVAPEDIVILGVDDSMLAAIRNRAGFPDGVSVCQVREFKGLERRVIILAATRHIADEPELAYVALSRPRTHLIIVGEPEILDWLGAPAAPSGSIR